MSQLAIRATLWVMVYAAAGKRVLITGAAAVSSAEAR
jgi:hypothetical protein